MQHWSQHLVQFRFGDIHAVVLPPVSFDVIMSLDVWCHILRRAALLQRCGTLLRSGGRLAFYNHAEVTQSWKAAIKGIESLMRGENLCLSHFGYT
jgi:2-polyprenyl-3-methyl-5-hydroxy-6-metoxy-1,4-benzoquinol methylase